MALDAIQADLKTRDWPHEAFDVVAAIFIQFAGPALRNRVFEGMKAALRPAGILLLQGYRPEQLAYGTGGSKAVENLYTEALLREALSDLRLPRALAGGEFAENALHDRSFGRPDLARAAAICAGITP